MKQVKLFTFLLLVVIAGSCANSEKKPVTAAQRAEMEAAAVQLANEMCSAKKAVADSAGDPAKIEEYNRISKELDDRYAALFEKYSNEEDVKRLNELLSDMTSNCIK